MGSAYESLQKQEWVHASKKLQMVCSFILASLTNFLQNNIIFNTNVILWPWIKKPVALAIVTQADTHVRPVFDHSPLHNTLDYRWNLLILHFMSIQNMSYPMKHGMLL